MRFYLVLGIAVLLVAAVGCSSAAPASPTATTAAAKPASTQAAQPASGAAAKTVELRAGSSDAPDAPNSVAMFKFAEIVNAKSKGALNVKVFPQSLGVEQQLTQSVMDGSVDMGQCSNGNIGRFTDSFFVFDLPFVFKTYDNGLKAMVGPSGAPLLARYEKDLGIKHLFVNSYGSGRDIETTKKQVRVPADLKGLKMRVVSTPVDMSIFKAWGANPTGVDWAQMYTALQQGIVDGMQNSAVALIPNKHHEVLKYVLRLEYQPIFELNFINRKLFDSLSPDNQKILMDSASEAQAWDWKYKQELVGKTFKDLEAAGLVITTPTKEERVQWTSVREKVWQEVGEEYKGKLDLNLAKQMYEGE